jgi:hypothetical protein
MLFAPPSQKPVVATPGLKFKRLCDQIRFIQRRYPNAAPYQKLYEKIKRSEYRIPENAPGATGWLAALNCGQKGIFFISTYHGALVEELQQMRKHEGLTYDHDIDLDSHSLRPLAHSQECMGRIIESQKGSSIVIFPAKFEGAREGYSLSAVREACEGTNRFCLGSLPTATAILGHPEWTKDEKHQRIDFSGDEFDSHGKGTHLSVLVADHSEAPFKLDSRVLKVKDTSCVTLIGFAI